MNIELDEILRVADNIDIIDDFSIPIDSPHNFVEALRKHAIRHAQCVKNAAQAIQIQNRLTLELEVIKSELVEEYMNKAEEKGKPIPASAIQEVRRTIIPKDPRYKKVFNKLIDATYATEYLKGLLWSWSTRDHRLTELTPVIKRQLHLDDYEPQYYRQKTYSEEELDNLDLDLEY